MALEKELTLLLTGLSDDPLDDLDGRTPFEVAAHPTLDWMLAEGSCDTFLPPDDGGEERALSALWGVRSRLYPGPLVALAHGLALGGRSAYCGRLCSAGQGTLVDVSDQLVSDAEGRHLCSLLSTDTLTFHHLQGPLFLLLADVKGVNTPLLSPAEIVGQKWIKLLPRPLRAQLPALLERLPDEELNELRLEMGEEPINALYCWGGGQAQKVKVPKPEGRLLCTSNPVLQGVARALEIELGRAPPTTLSESLSFLNDLPEATHLYLELPYLWQSTYKGDLREKIKRIEWLDRHLIAPLLDACAGKRRLTVMPLRHTSIRLGKALPGPVQCASFP